MEVEGVVEMVGSLDGGFAIFSSYGPPLQVDRGLILARLKKANVSNLE